MGSEVMSFLLTGSFVTNDAKRKPSNLSFTWLLLMQFSASLCGELDIFVGKQLKQFLFLHLDPPVPNLF